MRAIVGWCLKNRSVVALATVLLVAGGTYAAAQLNQELLPDIEFPLVVVSTPVPGAGPDVVDEQVTQPIEQAVGSVEGVESVQTTSAQGFSAVVLELSLEADVGEASDEIRAALEGVELPAQAQRPEVQELSAAEFPVMNVSLAAGDEDLVALTRYAEEEAIPLLESVEGVASVDLLGGAESVARVELLPEELEERGVSAAQVLEAIRGAEVNAPVGDVPVDGFSTPVRVVVEAGDLEALRDLPVGSGIPAEAGGGPAGAPGGVVGGFPGGAPEPVLLGDVAEVREVETDLAGISRTDGEPSLGLSVSKEPEANTVEVSRQVEAALDEVQGELGEEQVKVLFTSATAVENSVSGLVEKAVLGAVLALLVIFLFLGTLRATLVTAVSLPTSVLAALLFSWVQDLTLNIITLAGLTIAIGRVVDDAIVVLENSYRYIQRGYGPDEAALRGTTEVASAITSSTLVAIAVFLPLGLVGGIVSKFFLPLSITVALALVASLVVAVTLIPVLVSAFIRRRDVREAPLAVRAYAGFARSRGYKVAAALTVTLLAAGAYLLADTFGLFGVPPVAAAAGAVAAAAIFFAVGGLSRSGEEGRLVRLYTPALRWSLRYRAAVLTLAAAAFAGGLFVIPLLPVNFLPPSTERILVADIELEPGTSLERSGGEVRPFEAVMMDDPGVESYQISVGGEDTFTPDAPLRGDDEARAFVIVGEEAGVEETRRRLEREGEEIFGEENFRIAAIEQGPPAGDLEVTVTGDSQEDLEEAAQLVVDELRENEDVANVRTTAGDVAPEVNVVVDNRRAAGAGLSPEAVSGVLAALFGSDFELEFGGVPVSLGAPEESLNSLEKIRGLPLAPGVRVGDVAEVEEAEAPAAITRIDGERAVSVTGRITVQDTDTVSREVGEAVSELDLPVGTTASIGGVSEDIAESFRNLGISIAVAIALVYLILVVFFSSLLYPLVIMLAVPLTTVGAFGALLITNTALSVPALLGFLLLIGIVVSNSILLIDFATRARERHEDADEAVVEAGRARLRPILMTALATIFALLPLGLGLAEGGSLLISTSLALTVIGGLATSTLLTLFVVPVGYSVLESARRRLRGKKA
ncbi:efflux RND transporter permease subunit [Rubrobacter taiwanensis]|jgi:HAE1 family hydrophobic/amphiphilic exporter-1|uniref:Efflux RND transporter permease subunit n=1 Tax=Rubrobacter taiwanensis TaxID=185139 RepID=A0A4R1BS67_9ACTN|nr:efflux RND transporter permease subunit [Rubrobacter taiwanensis]TCJ20491.1 efflux RND transporter permease subunit [Rubrobacter taiwanensis]